MNIRIRKLDPEVRLPAYESAGAAGFDLAAAASVTVEPGTVRLVPTGLVIEVPQGFFLGIFARSSTPLKRGLMVANGVGVVDSDYCGPEDEVKIAVVNFTAAPVQIKTGDRIAQGIILAAPHVVWEEASELGRSRGRIWRTGTDGRMGSGCRRTGGWNLCQGLRALNLSLPPWRALSTADPSYPRCSLCTVQKTPRHAMQAEAGRTIRRRYQMRSPYQ